MRFSAGGLVGYDRDAFARRKSLFETFDAVLHRCHFRLIDDRHRTRTVECLAHDLRGDSAARHIVRGDVRDDFAFVGRTCDVGGEYRNARLIGFSDRRTDRLGIRRSENDRAHALADEIFDLRGLLGLIAVGVDEGYCVAVLSSFGFHT